MVVQLGECSARALQGQRGVVVSQPTTRALRGQRGIVVQLGECSARALQGHRCDDRQLLGGLLVLMFGSLSKKTFNKLSI
jgi:hypothetical protein